MHSGGLLMEAGRQLGLKSHFVLTVDHVVVQLLPVCGCSDEEGVFHLSCSTMRFYVRSVVAWCLGPKVASNGACCDALCLLHAVNVFLEVRVLDYGSIFQEGADKGDVILLFAGRWAASEITA